MFYRIKEETEDRIIIVDSVAGKIYAGLFFSALTLFFLYLGIYNVHNNSDILSSIAGLFLILLGAFYVLLGSFSLLINSKVTIDKKLQRLIDERKSIIKHFESVKMSDFSDIKEIEIVRTVQSECADTWSIDLNIKSGGRENIYCGDELNVKKMADKICKLTDKNISYPEKDYRGEKICSSS
ncbi:hypothetical protein C5S35_15750 [Candidatus Methanophagaceae archaeon]|jgi:hypothetical protein|nr:hypothetical protein C5S35_15750 [Methanophagales archaeon]